MSGQAAKLGRWWRARKNGDWFRSLKRKKSQYCSQYIRIHASMYSREYMYVVVEIYCPEYAGRRTNGTLCTIAAPGTSESFCSNSGAWRWMRGWGGLMQVVCAGSLQFVAREFPELTVEKLLHCSVPRWLAGWLRGGVAGLAGEPLRWWHSDVVSVRSGSTVPRCVRGMPGRWACQGEPHVCRRVRAGVLRGVCDGDLP